MSRLGLLSGASVQRGPESLADHHSRLGPLPPTGPSLSEELERSGLRGRGGAGFPAGVKWRAVTSGRSLRKVVVVNGAEGEPRSTKDRLLMSVRPHLILDGAVLAARTVGADQIVLYVGSEHRSARQALEGALRERASSDRVGVRLVVAPPRYVSGEESAAVHCINDGVALPIAVPPRPFESGVAGLPTLVHNIETLAHVALIARFGARWFRDSGTAGVPGTTLLTVSGAVERPGVIEVPSGIRLGDVLGAAGVVAAETRAVLMGGYFGGWIDGAVAHATAIDSEALRSAGHSLGCGVVSVLSESECGIVETARIMAFLADQSARQCGPCVFGLRAVADCWERVARRTVTSDDLLRVGRWTDELAGRGACRHPDGAATLARSALRVFAQEFLLHVEKRSCSSSNGALQAVS
jgi:NADH:ubiquinone oxidoreductase subunit F (NADH-binding)